MSAPAADGDAPGQALSSGPCSASNARLTSAKRSSATSSVRSSWLAITLVRNSAPAGGTASNQHGFATDLDSLPKGYYWSPAFLGTMFATGIGLSAATGAFGLAAPILGVINNDIGPDKNIVWVSLVYVVTMAIGLLLVGRLSDLFGRRVSRAANSQALS